MIPPAANVPKLFAGNAQTNETGWKICVSGDFDVVMKRRMEMDHPIFVDDFEGIICRDNRPIIFPFLLLLLLVVVLCQKKRKNGRDKPQLSMKRRMLSDF